MNTDEKLALSARENIITFIREGVLSGLSAITFRISGQTTSTKNKKKNVFRHPCYLSRLAHH